MNESSTDMNMKVPSWGYVSGLIYDFTKSVHCIKLNMNELIVSTTQYPIKEMLTGYYQSLNI